MKRRILALLLALTLILASMPMSLAEGDDYTDEAPAAAVETPVESKPAKEEAPKEKPAEDKPADEKPVEDKPAAEKPSEDKPAEEKPVEDKPIEDKPVVILPSEDKPVVVVPEVEDEPEEAPVETRPADEEPEDEKPVDEKPVDVKPVEEKPADVKPVENKPVDVKPVEEAPVVEQSEAEEAELAAPVKPENCAHPATRIEINRVASGITYIPLFDGTHKITGKNVASTVCVVCGKVLKKSNSFVEICLYDPTIDPTNACIFCGHIPGDDGQHVHSFTGSVVYTKGSYLNTVKSTENPELYHVDRYQKMVSRKCSECDALSPAELVKDEVIEEQSYHIWDGNVCPWCGQTTQCKHDGGIIEESTDPYQTYTFHSANDHTVESAVYTYTLCAKCGETLGYPELSETTDLESHNYDNNGICTDCGYKTICPHDHLECTYYEGDEPFTALNDRYHTAPDVFLKTAYCLDCGYMREYANREQSVHGMVTLPHEYDDEGVCTVCGYTTACAHPEASREYSEAPTTAEEVRAMGCHAWVEGPADVDIHLLHFVYTPYWFCKDCGHTEYMTDDMTEGAVPEDHKLVNGMCIVNGCGYVCEHLDVDGKPHTGETYYEMADDEEHAVMKPIVVSGTCNHCGMKLKEYEINAYSDGYLTHNFKNGVCEKCGYECVHSDEDIRSEVTGPHHKYSKYNAEKHKVKKILTYKQYCKHCGLVFIEDDEVLETYREKHEWRKGVCKQCNARLSDYEDDDDDDEEEVVEEVPVSDGFVDLASTDRLNGVAALDGLTMLETAKRVGDAMQHAVDAGYLSVSIVNIDKLFDSAELAQLQTLPVRDQLIAGLYFLGFRDVVFVGLANDPTLITAQTRSFIEAVNMRMNAMNASERATINSALRRYFPMADFQLRPGVSTEVFNLDLRVEENGSVTLQRYGFQQSDNNWVLVNIATRRG